MSAIFLSDDTIITSSYNLCIAFEMYVCSRELQKIWENIEDT